VTLLRVATWNVNSVRTRLQHLIEWLRQESPDIVLLQELKCIDDAFPFLEIEGLGYDVAVYGEKTYNGVGILSKYPLDDIIRGIPGNEDDVHARYIEAVIALPGQAVRIASVYVPNGSEITSDKYQYKLRFLEKFKEHMSSLLRYEEALIVGGDYNIAPTDHDARHPKAWKDSVLTHDEVRMAWRRLTNLGLYDAYRLVYPNSEHEAGYSWWDYRSGAFAANDGLRIDHLLLSPQAADRLTACRVEKNLRTLEKPSDHAPVLGSFQF
jgi:exodeoxyribonuclease III